MHTTNPIQLCTLISIAQENLGPIVDWVHANVIISRTLLDVEVLSSMVSSKIKHEYSSIALLHGGGGDCGRGTHGNLLN
jgi:hypothetical protein